MGQQEMAQLADLVMGDPALREQFRVDPTTAAKAGGIRLSSEDIAALESRDFEDLGDAELTARISKAHCI